MFGPVLLGEILPPERTVGDTGGKTGGLSDPMDRRRAAIEEESDKEEKKAYPLNGKATFMTRCGAEATKMLRTRLSHNVVRQFFEAYTIR